MPVLDGYRTTHLIRHHKPYSAIATIRTLPIVAMTASAIQGDKEKCKAAGMDDYLAKPVKGNLLEEMLVKWAVEGRNECRLSETLKRRHTENDSICAIPCSTHSRELSNSADSSSHSQPSLHQLTSSIFRVDKLAVNARQRAEEVEDQAWYLREDKLLAASEPDPREVSIALPRKSPTFRGPVTPLTFENVGLLNREVATDPFDNLFAEKIEAGSLIGHKSHEKNSYHSHDTHDMEYCDGESVSVSGKSLSSDVSPMAVIKEKEMDPIRHAVRAARVEKEESQITSTA